MARSTGTAQKETHASSADFRLEDDGWAVRDQVGICRACAHNNTCTYRRDRTRVMLYCPEFESVEPRSLTTSLRIRFREVPEAEEPDATPAMASA